MSTTPKNTVLVLAAALLGGCVTDFSSNDTRVDSDEDSAVDSADEDGATDSVDEDDCTASWWYYDADGDDFGIAAEALCSLDAPVGYTNRAGDCCDQDADVFPDQNVSFRDASECGTFDYNCDAVETPTFIMDVCAPTFTCTGYTDAETCTADHNHWCYDREIICGEESHYTHCAFVAGTCTRALDAWTAQPPACN
jgi:hypothetical protein